MVAATQAKSKRAEQNPHQQESTTDTNNEKQWFCCGAMHVTSSYNTCGVHAVDCAIQRPRATGTGSENPKAEIVDLLSSITFALSSWGCHGRAGARAPQKLATFDLQIVHWAMRFDTPACKLALVFFRQVRRCEQDQNSESMPNLHPRIFEELRGCAVRDLLILLWIGDTGPCKWSSSRVFVPFASAQPSTANAPN